LAGRSSENPFLDRPEHRHVGVGLLDGSPVIRRPDQKRGLLDAGSPDQPGKVEILADGGESRPNGVVTTTTRPFPPS
jgi:hypothetical protein